MAGSAPSTVAPEANDQASGSTPPTRRRLAVARPWLRIALWRTALCVVLLLAWEYYGGLSSRTEFFVSRPSLVVAALWDLVTTGDFYVDLRYTMVETAVGFLIGAVAGVAMGFVLAFLGTVHSVLDPLLNALNSLPRIALSSLFILWFGLGMESKIALVVSLVFFPLFLNAYKGATTVDPDHLLLMHTFRARRSEVVRKIIVPSTAPWVITGAKLGIAQALAGAVVGEIIAAQHGLGALLNEYSQAFATASMIAVLVAMIIIALLLNGIFSALERRTEGWR